MNNVFSIMRLYDTGTIYVLYREGTVIAVIYDEKIAYDTCDFLNGKFGYNISEITNTFLNDSYKQFNN